MAREPQATEPTPKEWATAREVVEELRRFDPDLSPKQLHLIRQTVIGTLIKMRETAVTACRPRD